MWQKTYLQQELKKTWKQREAQISKTDKDRAMMILFSC